jgi:putative ABC transport system permease protein
VETILGLSTTWAALGAAGALALGLAIAGFVAARQPLLLRLALRNVPRRPLQSLLIATGLALSTVIVTTALNTGDTMSHTMRGLVSTSVGRADEVIVQPVRDARRFGLDGVNSVANGTFLTGALTMFDEAEFARLDRALAGNGRIGGLLPAIIEEVVIASDASGVRGNIRLQAIPRDYPRVFGELTGTDGRAADIAQLPAGRAILNVDAATGLRAERGHTVRVSLNGRDIELVIETIVRNGPLSGAQATIVAPLDAIQRAAGLDGRINQILVANAGDPSTSVRASEDVARAIRPLLVDRQAADEAHRLLRADAARAELAAHLPGVEGRTRARLESLIVELEQPAPREAFYELVADPDIERRVATIGFRLAALQGRAGTNFFGGISPLRVIEVKRLSQELADRWGGALTNTFVVLSLFSLTTGALLVVFIFSLIAAERRSEMGIVRALGAKRRQLVGIFLFEGLAYDLVAAAIGAAIGVMLAVAIVSATASLVSEFGIELTARIEPRSLLLAYCLGAVLTMVSVGVGAWSAARATAAAAIRNVPEARPERPRRAALVTTLALVVGVVAAGWGIARDVPAALGAGIFLVGFGLAGACRLILRQLGVDPVKAARIGFSIGGLVMIAYWLPPDSALRDMGLRPLPRNVDLLFVAGLSVVLGSVWLLVFNLDLVARLARIATDGKSGGWLVVRSALAFPAQHRGRTGMSVAMFALVIFGLVVAAVLMTGTHRAYSDPSVMSGGFDIRVDQTIGGAAGLSSIVGTSRLGTEGAVAAIGLQQGAPIEAIQPGQGAQIWRPIPLQVVDAEFTRSVQAGFVTRARGYSTDAEIWRALRERPGTAIIAGPAVRTRDSQPLRNVEPGRPGGFRIDGVYHGDTGMDPQTLWIRDTRGGRAMKLTVIGVLDPRALIGTGLYTSAATHAASGAPQPGRSTYFLTLAEGRDVAETVSELNALLIDRGLRASQIGEEVGRIQTIRSLLSQLLQGFIGVGLMAGIAGLGVLCARAVVERRQMIGMMRALGFRRRQVQAAFLLEAALLSTLGIGVGVALGLAMAHRLVQFLSREWPEIVFVVPWDQIGLVAAVALGASLLTTLLPAISAGGVAPAEALRAE